MVEKLPMPEHKEVKPAEQLSYRELIKKRFEKFLALPDEPGLSYEEQNALLKKSQAGDEEAAKKYSESKRSKYRRNSLAVALMNAQIYLDSPESAIPPEKSKELKKRIDRVTQDVINVSKVLLNESELETAAETVKETALPEKSKNILLNKLKTAKESGIDLNGLFDIMGATVKIDSKKRMAKKKSRELEEKISEAIKRTVEERAKTHKDLLTEKEINKVIEIVKDIQPYLEESK